MRFIEHGPQVPDLLWRAHENGDVIFFCGAGVSRPADLPDFKGLVDQLYGRLGTDRDDAECEAEKSGRYDSVVDLLEIRLGDRRRVREAICEILTPKSYEADGVLDTHKALLTLGRAHDGNLRIVTTNYDRLFIHAGPAFPSFSAPLLPIPKRPRWHGIVHLHGLMPADKDRTALNNMVVTSGDFGLAYLTERWASRFVTELFRSYVVCFVGYSIDDPVLRYMVDALSADQQMLGESANKVYAFAPYLKDHAAEAERKWRAKKVIPILYDDATGHLALHGTLRQWAADYRDGLNGKSATVVREAATPPSEVQGDDQIDRVLWALSEPSGAPALAFARMEPPPAIEWLRVFREPRYGFEDLPQFGIQPTKQGDDPRANARLRFSLLNRPSQYRSAHWMRLVDASSAGGSSLPVDRIMGTLAYWLAKHLHRHELLDWVISSGGSPHPVFIEAIEQQIQDRMDLPAPIKTIWRFLCAGLVASPRTMTHTLTDWSKKLKSDGNTGYVRAEFYDLLRPRFHFGEARRWPSGGAAGQGADDALPARVKDYIFCDATVFCGEDIVHLLPEMRKTPHWDDLVLDMLPDFTNLLHQTMLLLQDLGDATPERDHSYMLRPQIADHEQNRDSRPWVKLVELCRDSLLLAAKRSPEKGRSEMRRWSEIEFPIFKRMAFFGATATVLLDPSEGLALLLSSDAWWLWSTETQREAIRFVVHLAAKLDSRGLDRLCDAILLGPPKTMFESFNEDRADVASEYRIWFRLAKIKDAGTTLPVTAVAKLAELSNKYPSWEIAKDQSDEFSSFLRVGGGIGMGRGTVPRQRRPLVDYFIANPELESDWFDVCRSQPAAAVTTLMALAQKGVWRPDLWGTALQALSDPARSRFNYRYLLSCLKVMPSETFDSKLPAIAWWLNSTAKILQPKHEDDWFAVVDRMIEANKVEYVPEEPEDPMDTASSHPIGEVTSGLIEWWSRTRPIAGKGLDPRLASRFERVFDERYPVSVFARMVAARNLYVFFLVDPVWTGKHMIPLFDWETNPSMALSMWSGYLFNPRIDAALLAAIKKPFLKVADKHFDKESDYIKQYGGLLMGAALDISGIVTPTEFRAAFKMLPKAGLHEAAFLMSRSMTGVGNDDPARAEDYWANRVLSVLKEMWPKDAAMRTDDTSAELAEVCLATGKHFKSAFEVIKPFLITVPHTYTLLQDLDDSAILRTYPREALELLGLIFDTSGPASYDSLISILKTIRETDSALTEDVVYKKLDEYLQRSGRG